MKEALIKLIILWRKRLNLNIVTAASSDANSTTVWGLKEYYYETTNSTISDMYPGYQLRISNHFTLSKLSSVKPVSIPLPTF